jgi:hypothetical protein
MTSYVLLKVTGDGPPGANFDVTPHEGAGVRVLAAGTAAAAMAAAAGECSSDELHEARLTGLPAIHRKVGAAEAAAAGLN